MIKKPMLSALAENEHRLRNYWPGPVLASPKLDGIRCLTHPTHGVVSRNFKPIPNLYIRDILDRGELYLDGELITFTDGVMDDYNDVQSKVMSSAGTPEFLFMVFDNFRYPHLPFAERLGLAHLSTNEKMHSVVVPHAQINTPDDFIDKADSYLAQGYEGAMYRHPSAPYKEGRSTLSQGWLVKWKNIADAEGTVAGFVEQMHNDNEATENIFGRTERSSHKANMKPKGTLGALLLDTSWGTLRVGTGYTDAQRQEIWDNQSSYIGKQVTFKYQPEGVKTRPRFPVFKGWRTDK